MGSGINEAEINAAASGLLGVERVVVVRTEFDGAGFAVSSWSARTRRRVPIPAAESYPPSAKAGMVSRRVTWPVKVRERPGICPRCIRYR